MKTTIAKFALLAAIGMMFSFSNTRQAEAQFSKAVVLLKGSVRMDQSGKAYSAKISIRSAQDESVEIRATRSNSETGEYLIVLQPNTKYTVRIEGQDIAALTESIETPASSKTINLSKDFTLSSGSTLSISPETAGK